MSKNNKGYIILWRKLQDHWLWESDEPFDSRSAWIDLLLLANHDDKKIPYGKGFVIIRRGQHLTSQRKLAERWHWSRPRVSRYIKRLKSDGMILADSTRGDTTITIVNYDSLQIPRATNDATHVTKGVTEGVTEGVTQTIHYTIHNTKNEEKKEKPSSFSAPRDGGEWQ